MVNPALSPAVMQALRRRGIGSDSPTITQVSPDARVPNPIPQPTNPSAMPTQDMPAAGSIPSAPKFSPQSQDDMIVMALIEKMKNNGKAAQEPIAPMGGGMQAPQMSKSPKQMQTDPLRRYV